MRASQTVHSQLPTRSDRLDSLPFGREHRKLLVGSGVGWALDAMDVGLISYVMAALVAEWSLSKTQASWLGSIGFVGMIIGTSVGGLLANKWGRRNVFALTLLTYGIATGAAVFSVGLVILLILRFNVGVGLGVELPVASTLVSEFAPCKNRGCIVVALESFWAVGWIMPALLGYFLVPKEWGGWPGWRWALLVGIVQVGPSRYLVPVCGVARLPHGWCGCLLDRPDLFGVESHTPWPSPYLVRRSLSGLHMLWLCPNGVHEYGGIHKRIPSGTSFYERLMRSDP